VAEPQYRCEAYVLCTSRMLFMQAYACIHDVHGYTCALYDTSTQIIIFMGDRQHIVL